MRINVYAEEISGDVEIVEKNGFYGVRFYLHSPKQIHDTPEDNDRSAVTFWGLKTTRPVLEKALRLFK